MIWAGKDLERLVQITGGYVACGLIPRSWDGAVSEILGEVVVRVARGRVARLAKTMQRVLGQRLGGRDPRALAQAFYRLGIEEGWGRARDLHRKGWRARLQLQGEKHVREALAAGRGAILWGMQFCGGRILKAALWQAGIPVVQLSREDHGAPSRSGFALRVLGPLYRRAERRYLAGSVVAPLEGFPRHMEQLLAVLQENLCLSIMGELEGRQNVVTRFLDGRARFATGAAGLAYATGAALLTVYAFRAGPMYYRVEVEPPLEVDRRLPRRQFVQQAVEQFAARLERHVVEHPADWQTWRNRERVAEVS